MNMGAAHIRGQVYRHRTNWDWRASPAAAFKSQADRKERTRWQCARAKKRLMLSTAHGHS